MITDEAYGVICEYVRSSGAKKLVRNELDKENFGNFVISFMNGDIPCTILCDRSQIVVYADLIGEEGCRLAIPNLLEVSKAQLLAAIEQA